MKKIIFVQTNPNFNKIHYEVFEGMQEKGYEVEVITNTKSIKKYYEKRNIKVLYATPASGSRDIERYELEYKFIFNGYFFRELQLYKKNQDKLKRSVSGYIDFFKKLNKEDLLCIVNNGEGILNICAWLYCKRADVNFIQNEWVGHIPGKRMMNRDIQKLRWMKKEHYTNELTEEDKREVLELLNYNKEKKRVVGLGSLPMMKLGYIKKFFDLLLNYYSEKELMHEVPSPFFFLNLYLMRFFNKNRSGYYQRRFDSTQKYFYFPLHEVYDSAVLINHYKFFKQDEIIKNISKALPEGYVLYVKEHPVVDGTVPLKWYKELFKLRNVVMLPSVTNSYDIVKSSAGIITISSTVGYEALQYQKPVVVLGDPFYNIDDLTIKVKDPNNINELKAKIGGMLNKRIDMNKVYRLVNAVIKSHYDGAYFIDGYNINMSKENIQKIVDSTIAECEYTGEIL